MECVRSVGYTNRFNSIETAQFKPMRGLRQDDLLSPYLFLLVDEGPSALLMDAERRGQIEGFRVCRGAPSVSRLFFADNSLILMKTGTQNANCLKQILDLDCSA